MEPFYFGEPTKLLYGCYDAPQAGRTRGCGVVLCYPLGHEYIAAHRAYRQLALRLSRAGFPVLRFDFYGCGDSNGESDRGTIAQWLSDVAIAIEEIRARSRFKKVCLIGLRLGGALSALVGADRDDIASIVLWNPVVSGRLYLQETAYHHRETLRHLSPQLQPDITSERPTEILGFPITDSLRTELENLDLFKIRRKSADDVLIIETKAEAGTRRLWEHLRHLEARGGFQYLPSPDLEIRDLNKLLVPSNLLQAVVSWMCERYV